MTRHQETLDDLALHDVALHDLGHVGFRAHPVPDALWVDHDARSVLAMVQASGFVGPHGALQPEPVYLLLKESLEPLGYVVGAAPAWVPLGPLVDTDENVMLEAGHWLDLRGISRPRTTGRFGTGYGPGER